MQLPVFFPSLPESCPESCLKLNPISLEGTNNITATKTIDQRSSHVALGNGTAGTLRKHRDVVIHDGLAAAATLAHRTPISLTATVGWKPLGCYTDMDGDRTLRYSVTDLIRTTNKLRMTVKACQDGCYNEGYRWAGVEYGYQCCKWF
jgi:hypothetical protein